MKQAMALLGLLTACGPAQPLRDLDDAELRARKAAPPVRRGYDDVGDQRPDWLRQAPYSELFRLGRRWRLAGSLTTRGPARDAEGELIVTTVERTLSCEVAGLSVLGDAVVSNLGCDRDIGVAVPTAGPRGYYVATRQGLWLFETMPDAVAIARLDPASMLWSATGGLRVARSLVDGLELSSHARDDGSTCILRSWDLHDPLASTLCLHPHGGLVDGRVTFGDPISGEFRWRRVE